MAKIAFKKKNKTEEILLREGDMFLSVDIGTEILKGLLCRITSSGIEVIKSSHVWQQHYAMRSGVIQNIEAVTSNLELVYNDLVSDLIGKQNVALPQKIILGVAGELVSGEPVMVSYDRDMDSSAEIDEEEERAIISNVREKVILGGVEDLANKLDLKSEDIIPLHVDLGSVEIGNIRVKRLAGFKGRSVKLFFNAVFAPYTLVEALVSVVKKLQMEIISIVSQPFAVAKGYTGSGNIDFDGIFIDIGGGTTDVAIVSKGIILNSYMLAFGGRIFTERISKEMNIDYRFAEKRKIKYSNGELKKHISKELKDLIRQDVSLWADGVRLTLSEFSDVRVLPSQIFLCGGGSLLPDIREIILAYPWKQYLRFIKHPKAKIVKPNEISNIIDKVGLTDTIDVTPLAIASYVWLMYLEPKNHLSLKL